MNKRTPRELYRHAQNWGEIRLLALSSPCLGEDDALAFVSQHRPLCQQDRTLSHPHGYGWRVGLNKASAEVMEPAGCAAPILLSIDELGFDQVIVLIEREPIAVPASAPIALDELTTAYRETAKACLLATPTLSLDDYYNLRCLVHYDDAANLQGILTEFEAEIVTEQYCANGLQCEIRVPGEYRAHFSQRLRESSMHPAQVDPIPSSGQATVNVAEFLKST